MGSNLEDMLMRVRDGRADFGEFVAGTRREFRAMATHLMRRWSTPEWFVVEDAEQELYLEAWRCLWKYDPSRGTTFARYVVFNSMSQAKREMHKARGVSTTGSPDNRPSNFEARVGDCTRGDDDQQSFIDSLLNEEPVAEARIEDRQDRAMAATRALRACVNQKERYAVLAIREAGSLDMAGSLLYDDVDHRLDLRLGNEAHAERFVYKHAVAVARRMAPASTRVDATTPATGT